MSVRKFSVLLEGLPRSSKLAQALDPTAQWTVGEHLASMTLDAIEWGNWQRWKVARAKPLPPMPQPHPRPGVVTAAEEQEAALLDARDRVRERAQRRKEGRGP